MKRFKNILLVVDDLKQDENTVQTALGLAQRNSAQLTVIKVLDEPTNFYTKFTDIQKDTLLAKLHDDQKALIFQHLEPYPENIDITVTIEQGKVFWEIISAVLKQSFDLVIKTCTQSGYIKNLVFGSTDMHLLRKCPCPVWLIKPEKKAQCKRILAAIDIQPSADDNKLDGLNQQLLEMATSLAVAEKAELHIVHAWMVAGKSLLVPDIYSDVKDEFQKWVKEQENEIKTREEHFKMKVQSVLGEKGFEHLTPEIHAIEGDAEEVVPQFAEKKEIDLVLMGTVARTGLSGFFMGNTAEIILNQLNCSVLTIKPSGFQSPVTLE